ncbi:orotidine-5'-phosphate decarboxylase [Methyloraptor flagellatus]|uniref:Orotidine 5'-phosphate decarboxylase n=1 Tax=Methyloraptor flagellatus TaxID=3162530 RepID=A0AAU7X6T6_9HYPH
MSAPTTAATSFAPNDPRDRLILALDVPTVAEAEAIVEATRGSVGVYKIGHQLVFSGGLGLAERLLKAGEKVFLDVKLLDIDNTVAHGIESIAALGPTFVTLHAYPKAMRAAVAAKRKVGGSLTLLGVTVLTSMDDADLAEAGYAGTVKGLVATRAAQARAAGMDGLVCSPEEAGALRAIVGPDMLLVTPGVRPAGAAAGDQKRVMTPEAAIRGGSDLLVVGRPILAATDRRAAADAIVAEIEAGLKAR